MGESFMKCSAISTAFFAVAPFGTSLHSVRGDFLMKVRQRRAIRYGETLGDVLIAAACDWLNRRPRPIGSAESWIRTLERIKRSARRPFALTCHRGGRSPNGALAGRHT